MIKKTISTGLLFISVLFFSCGGGGSKSSEALSTSNTKYVSIEGSMSAAENSYIRKQASKNIRYILAATYINGKPYFVSGAVDYNGNFDIKLLVNKSYSFVLFDNKLKPVAYVKKGDYNALLIKKAGTIKMHLVLIDENNDGYPDYAVPGFRNTENIELLIDNRFVKDRNKNNKPDVLEVDNNKNKKFDGMEDNNKNGYPDTLDDENKNNIPDVLEKNDNKGYDSNTSNSSGLDNSWNDNNGYDSNTLNDSSSDNSWNDKSNQNNDSYWNSDSQNENLSDNQTDLTSDNNWDNSNNDYISNSPDNNWSDKNESDSNSSLDTDSQLNNKNSDSWNEYVDNNKNNSSWNDRENKDEEHKKDKKDKEKHKKEKDEEED